MFLTKLLFMCYLAVSVQGQKYQRAKEYDSRFKICHDWLCNCINIKYVEIIVSTLSLHLHMLL